MGTALLDPLLANTFLTQYKRLLSTVAAKPLESIENYVEARGMLYKDEFNKHLELDSSYERSFKLAVKDAAYGMFIFAKKYKYGYAFKSTDDTWLFAKALTTPLEELIPDWVVVDTAILPYCGTLVCDGLIVDRHVFIGGNMIKDMIQKLKIERRKWAYKH